MYFYSTEKNTRFWFWSFSCLLLRRMKGKTACPILQFSIKDTTSDSFSWAMFKTCMYLFQIFQRICNSEIHFRCVTKAISTYWLHWKDTNCVLIYKIICSGDFFKKVEIELPYDPAIPLLGTHTEETRIERNTCTPMFITALFLIARTWKQPRCPSADEWTRKLWYIYTMEYYSAIKKNTFESVIYGI